MISRREVVILVDDNALFLKLLSKWAEESGYEPLIAPDGETALALLQDIPSATVFSDGMMPGMSGIELCRALRARPHSGLFYFVLLTADEDPDAYRTAFEAGVDDFLPKPIRKDLFTSRLQVASRIHRTLEDAHNGRISPTPGITSRIHALSALQEQLMIALPVNETGPLAAVLQMGTLLRELQELLEGAR